MLQIFSIVWNFEFSNKLTELLKTDEQIDTYRGAKYRFDTDLLMIKKNFWLVLKYVRLAMFLLFNCKTLSISFNRNYYLCLYLDHTVLNTEKKIQNTNYRIRELFLKNFYTNQNVFSCNFLIVLLKCKIFSFVKIINF